MPLIAVLGSLNVDLVSVVERHPNAGETIHGTSFSKSPGGKGSNQAAACARLSRSNNAASNSPPLANVMMLGCVGTDSYGELLINHLNESGCDISHVQQLEGEDTGVAVITVESATGENRIIVHGLANSSVLVDRFPDLPQKPDLLIMQLEIPFETVLYHARLAKKDGVKIMLNPSPVRELPDELLASVTYLVVNESEAAVLAGISLNKEFEEGGPNQLITEDGKPHPWLEEVIQKLLGKGCEHIIITLGKHGAVFGSKSSSAKHVPGVKVAKVVDTTGAGDTFVGALAVELVTKGDGGLEEAIKLANKAASVKIQRAGAVSVPWRDEVENA